MIPVCSPSITRNEIGWVRRALKENRISSVGGFVDLFEERFAEKIGTKYCVAVNSGGSALFLTLWALGIREKDEVIVPDFTMIATANAVAQCGAKPVFVDACWDTCNIDVSKIEEVITSRTKAIMPVHIYGHSCDMGEIMKIAKKHKLAVVEDCAEAHGAEYHNQIVGSFGVAGCFSFYGNKIITCGDGGAITTNNKKLADELRRLRAYYFSPVRHFDHKKIAWNLRMSSLEAAVGLGQLERWDKLIKARRENALYYNFWLREIVETPIEVVGNKSVFWMYLIKVGKDRDELMKFLEKRGIETRTGFFPMHWQKPYKEDYKKYPISNKLGKESLYLPSASNLTEKKQNYIIKQIREFYANKTKEN